MTGPTTTDNRNTDAKVKLRLDWLDGLGLDEVRVLDAFGGEGVIWAAVQARRPDITIFRTGIEKNRKKGNDSTTLHGDNMSYLPHVSLHHFDAIDLDSWGWPTEQLQVVAERAPEKHVFVTCGMYVAGIPTADVFEAAGIPKEWGTLAPGLWGRFHMDLWDSFLAGLGYRHTVRMIAPPDKGGNTMVYDHLFPVGSDG